MSDLKPETRALLELGSDHDPSDEAIDRNRRALALRMGGALLAGGAIAGSTSKALAASTASAGGWLTAKVIALCGIVVIGGGAVVGSLALRGEPSAAPAPTVRLVVAPPSPPAPAVQARPQASASQAVAEAEPPGSARPAPPAKDTGTRSIQAELELVRAAQKHLHRNEAKAALAVLAEHARRFPNGALSEEREASRVVALCQLGDAAGARAQAERFIRRSPNSPFVERVRAACRSGAP